MVTKRYCFDLDGTICSTVGLDYELSKPITSRVDHINSLYDQGHYIIIFTARGSLSGQNYEVLTKDQLSRWGVKHSELILGKPAADFYIDDKGVNSETYTWLN